MAAALPNPVDAPVMSTDFDRAGVHLEDRTTALQHLGAVHLPQRIGDQFDASPVRVPEIQRDAAVLSAARNLFPFVVTTALASAVRAPPARE